MKEDEEEIGCGCSCEGCHGCSPEAEVDEEEITDGGILTFVDEEGNDVKFEILDVISMNDKEYLVVLPTEESDNDDDQGVLILEIKEENGEEVYDTVTDEEEAEKVFKKFEEENELEDEDEEKTEK